MTGSVVDIIAYLTVHLVSVTLTGITRVVMMCEDMDGVVTLDLLVCVIIV